MSLLSLQTYQEPDTVRIALSGELDLSSALLFEDELRRVEEERQPPVLLLDLSSLKFMDSTGLRLILNAHTRAARAGRRLRILQGSDSVKRIFRLTGVFERLDLVDEPLPAGF
jgi:anti-anti-sigma factor